MKNKVIVSVPDIHSRKPNLKRVFEEVLPRGYTALEMFARNLTAGWWGWGDEVMKFQGGEYWAQEEVVEGEEVVGPEGDLQENREEKTAGSARLEEDIAGNLSQIVQPG